jgi:hypothetical protein
MSVVACIFGETRVYISVAPVHGSRGKGKKWKGGGKKMKLNLRKVKNSSFFGQPLSKRLWEVSLISLFGMKGDPFQPWHSYTS